MLVLSTSTDRFVNPPNRDRSEDSRSSQSKAIPLALLLSTITTSLCAADTKVAPDKSDQLALAALFNEQHYTNVGPLIVEHSRHLPPEKSFQLLHKWVLPSELHQNVRVTTDFVSSAHQLSDDRPTLLSPALELIATARQLDRLAELTQEIEQLSPTEPADQSNRLALLYLTAIARDDLDAAQTHLSRFLDLVADPEILTQTEPAVLLVLQDAVQRPTLGDVIGESLLVIKEHYRTKFPQTAWHRTLQRLFPHDAQPHPIDGGQWTPVSCHLAYYHGRSFPPTMWNIEPGRARQLSSHSDDFLFFASPLQGSYEVEAEALGFGYHDTDIMVAGRWATLASDHENVRTGNIRGDFDPLPIGFKFTDTNDHKFIHTRAMKQDDQLAVDLNGHRVFETPVTSNQFPWVAIRSFSIAHGGVDDLTISGSPTIPQTIDMIGSDQLLGWYDYYQHPDAGANALGGWQTRPSPASAIADDLELFSLKDPGLPPNSHAERLLRYARPVLEDGHIEYFFWYEDGVTNAHPAIGTQALLITPHGLYQHPITDGPHDQTQARPDARTLISNSPSLPLQNATWNHVQLTFKGEAVAVRLNDEPIATATLPMPFNERTFGLFHYADQTSLRVRDLNWTGQWPTTLPTIDQQILVDPIVRQLAMSSSVMPNQLRIKTNESTRANDFFSISRQSNPGDVTVSTDDVHIEENLNSRDYADAAISPNVEIEGDFDFTLGFRDLNTNCEEGSNAGVRVMVRTTGELRESAMLKRLEGSEGNQRLECATEVFPNGQYTPEFFGWQPCQTGQGKLKISRRGRQFYFLFAENDSPHFRLVDQREFVDDSIRMFGLRGEVELWGKPKNSPRIEATFTELEVQAESYSRWLNSYNLQVGYLQEQRKRMPTVSLHDFRHAAPDLSQVKLIGNTAEWDESNGGLLLESESINGSGITWAPQLGMNFIVTCDLAELNLPEPLNSNPSASLALQISLHDPDETQCVVRVLSGDNGALQARFEQHSTKNDNIELIQTIPLSFQKPGFLQVERFGQFLNFAVGGKPEEQAAPKEIKTIRVESASFGVHEFQLKLDSSNSNSPSSAVVSSIEVKTTNNIELRQGVPDVQEQPTPNPPPKPAPSSLFDNIQNLFK